MRLDHLWAGWRSSYVASVTDKATDGGESGDRCVFCRLLQDDEADKSNLVIHRNSLTAALLNAFPYTSGHLLVMPIRHVREPDELTADESEALWRSSWDAVTAIRGAYKPDGLNLGVNLGRAAGAGLPEHLHVHVLPRWVADTSFITSVAEARVLPEALSETSERLRDAWPS
ncbi:MAG: HIT domain-containing protein [Acidimicrobiales bacterium]